MYVSAQNGVFALDPLSGTQRWKFEAAGTSRRGLAYWPGDGAAPGTLFIGSQTKLLAINPTDGRLVQSFGQGGFVDMGTPMQSPPAIYKDILIAPQVQPVIRAWNAKTGALLWTFNLIAQPGDPTHETWENDAWKTIGGTNVWGYLSVDDEARPPLHPGREGRQRLRGLAATRQQPVQHVAGRGRRQHRQDEVVPAARAPRHLGLRPRRGADPVRRRRGRQDHPRRGADQRRWALLFIFNRETGEPIFGIEERQVPQTSAPGEWTSPTQPFPIKPPPLARNSLKRSELSKNVTPEHKAFCEALWDKYKLEDSVPYDPWRVGQDILVFPGAMGGGNWHGVTFNKPLGLIITNVMNAGQWGHLEEGSRRTGAAAAVVAAAVALADPARRRRGGGAGAEAVRLRRSAASRMIAAARRWARSRRRADASGIRRQRWSCSEPPWGELVAVNANTGDIAWRVPLGEFEELAAKGHQDRHAQLRRRHHHGRQPGVHRRHHRRLLPRLRRAQRQELWTTSWRPRRTVPNLHGPRRQAVRRGPAAAAASSAARPPTPSSPSNCRNGRA